MNGLQHIHLIGESQNPVYPSTGLRANGILGCSIALFRVNANLDILIEFRRVCYGGANEYIHKHVKDPRGTGGTPYRQWLNRMILETEAYKF